MFNKDQEKKERKIFYVVEKYTLGSTFFEGSKYTNIAARFLAVNNEMVPFIFIEYGQDKIPPPHQVRSSQSRPGLFSGSALQQEQGSTRQGLRMSGCYGWHY